MVLGFTPTNIDKVPASPLGARRSEVWADGLELGSGVREPQFSAVVYVGGDAYGCVLQERSVFPKVAFKVREHLAFPLGAYKAVFRLADPLDVLEGKPSVDLGLDPSFFLCEHSGSLPASKA